MRGERGKRNTTVNASFFASVTRTGENPKGSIFIGVCKPNWPHCIDAIACATLVTGHFFSILSFQILFSTLKIPWMVWNTTLLIYITLQVLWNGVYKYKILFIPADTILWHEWNICSKVICEADWSCEYAEWQLKWSSSSSIILTPFNIMFLYIYIPVEITRKHCDMYPLQTPHLTVVPQTTWKYKRWPIMAVPYIYRDSIINKFS